MPSDPVHARLRRPLLVLAASGCVFAAVAAVHVGMDALARGFERRGAALWWEEQHLRLFMRSNHAHRGSPRIVFTGSSEAREAFVGATLNEGLVGREIDLQPWIWATLEELVLFLELLEGAHGDDAVPDALVVGVTPRYVAEMREFPSPFYAAIDKYSPDFGVERGDGAPRLIEKGLVRSLRARVSYVKQQGNRYRSACQGVIRAALVALEPDLADDPRLAARLVTNTVHHLPDWTLERKRDFFLAPERIDPYFDIVIRNNRRVLAWDPDQDRARIERRFVDLRAIVERHGIRLFFVNLPELSWNRAGYDPEHYAAYLRILREASGGAPLLDLQSFLSDEEFQDHQHANRAGARRLSERTAEFLAQHMTD